MGGAAESIRPFREDMPRIVRDCEWLEVRKPLPHKACGAGTGIKKGELTSVHLFQLVETAGIEPASANPPLSDLHAYSVFGFNQLATRQSGKTNGDFGKVLVNPSQTYFFTILCGMTPVIRVHKHTSGRRL